MYFLVCCAILTIIRQVTDTVIYFTVLIAKLLVILCWKLNLRNSFDAALFDLGSKMTSKRHFLTSHMSYNTMKGCHLLGGHIISLLPMKESTPIHLRDHPHLSPSTSNNQISKPNQWHWCVSGLEWAWIFHLNILVSSPPWRQVCLFWSSSAGWGAALREGESEREKQSTASRNRVSQRSLCSFIDLRCRLFIWEGNLTKMENVANTAHVPCICYYWC